jgi:4-hydroxybenzoate polyprenyltransferase
VSFALLASYAHVVNDCFDVEADARAGKPNTVASLDHRGRAIRIGALLVAGLVPWLWFPPRGLALVALALIVLVPLAYSAPPLRLKERGVGGVLADATMAHGATTLFVSLVFADVAVKPVGRTALVVGLTTAWALLVGLRAILVHQIQDVSNDEAAGTSTYVVTVGVARARAICVRRLFPAEVCLLVALLVVLAPASPQPCVFFVAYAVVFQAARRAWQLSQDPAPLDPRTPLALFEFYPVWPPLVFGLALTARDPRFAILVAAHVVLFRSAVVRQVRGIASRVVPFIRLSGSLALRSVGLRRPAG